METILHGLNSQIHTDNVYGLRTRLSTILLFYKIWSLSIFLH